MSSVSQIEVPGPNGPLCITSQQEVEQHLSEALALHFQLTAHSPFLVDPLCYELGLLGISLAAQAILQGTYQCPAGINLYTQQLITILKIPPRSSTVPSRISRDNIGSTPGNALLHPTPVYTMATTRQVWIVLGLQSSMH